jgi:hypothetical protein
MRHLPALLSLALLTSPPSGFARDSTAVDGAATANFGGRSLVVYVPPQADGMSIQEKTAQFFGLLSPPH